MKHDLTVSASYLIIGKVFEDDEKDIDELHEEANKDYQPQDDSTQGKQNVKSFFVHR